MVKKGLLQIVLCQYPHQDCKECAILKRYNEKNIGFIKYKGIIIKDRSNSCTKWVIVNKYQQGRCFSSVVPQYRYMIVKDV